MLVDAALGFCNHLLTQEAWARDRLRPFSGQTARLQAGALSFSLTITTLGFLRAAQPNANAAVSLSLPADALWRFSEGREAVLAATHISGRADFADTLAFLLHHLRWDAEADLAPFFGDIVAHRLMTGLTAFAGWQKRKVEGAAHNLAEYLRDESRDLVAPQELRACQDDVHALAAATDQLERRISRLGN